MNLFEIVSFRDNRVRDSKVQLYLLFGDLWLMQDFSCISEAAAIVRMIAIAVAHLHTMNIAHRDLKVCMYCCKSMSFAHTILILYMIYQALLFEARPRASSRTKVFLGA